MRIIDTHQHFWRFLPEEYSWIEGVRMAPLRRDFQPPDLAPLLREEGVAHTILVEARGHEEETERILRIAAEADFVCGVVGWLPLTAEDFPARLEERMRCGWLCGLRHAVAVEPDAGYMERDDFNRGLAEVSRQGLSYDLLVRVDQLSRAAQLAGRHPDLHFVLDHFAKPDLVRGELQPWASSLRELARRPNVFCKVSGLSTEGNENWRAQVQPFFDVALEAFGPQRMMFGSDWPVVNVQASYAEWIGAVRDLTAHFSPSEQQQLWSETACRAYRLARGDGAVRPSP